MRYRPFSTLFGNWNVTSSVARMSEDDKLFFHKLDKASAEAERQFMEREKCKQTSPEQARSYPQRTENKLAPDVVAEKLGARVLET